MPVRKPTNRESVGSAASMNSCHFSWDPAPSNEKMMNCGAFSPFLSFTIGTLPAGRPSGDVVGAVVVGFGVVFLVVVGGLDDGVPDDALGAVDEGEGGAEVVADGDGAPETVEVMVTTTSDDASFTGVEVPR